MSLGAMGAFTSLDLFFFYIFHEFALIPTFLLIGIWGTQNRQFASFQVTIYLMAGSLILLAGLVALVMAAAARRASHLRHSDTLQAYILAPSAAARDRRMIIFPSCLPSASASSSGCSRSTPGRRPATPPPRPPPRCCMRAS